MANLFDYGLEGARWWYNNEKIDDAEDYMSEGFQQGREDVQKYADPYFNNGLEHMGQYNDMGEFGFSYDNYLNSENYDWLRDEGMRGVNRTAAASHALGSGNTLDALVNRNQNYAQAQYGQEHGRQLAEYDTNKQYHQFPMQQGLEAGKFAGQFLSDMAIGEGATMADLQQSRAANLNQSLNNLSSAGDDSLGNTVTDALSWAADKLGLTGASAVEWAADKLGIGTDAITGIIGGAAASSGYGTGAVAGTGLSSGVAGASGTAGSLGLGAAGATGGTGAALGTGGFGGATAGIGESALGIDATNFGSFGGEFAGASEGATVAGETAAGEAAASGITANGVVAAGMWAAAAYVGYKIIGSLFSHERNTSANDLGEEQMEKTGDPWAAAYSVYAATVKGDSDVGWSPQHARAVALDTMNNPMNKTSASTEMGANFMWDAVRDTISGKTGSYLDNRDWYDDVGKSVRAVYGTNADTTALSKMLEGAGAGSFRIPTFEQWKRDNLSAQQDRGGDFNGMTDSWLISPAVYEKKMATKKATRARVESLITKIMLSKPAWDINAFDSLFGGA